MPHYFRYSTPGDRRCARPQVVKALAEIIGYNDLHVEVALGEAVINALQHGMSACIKINRIGDFLVLRVRDDGQGFAGNEAVAKVTAHGIEATFRAKLLDERGRGIPIMAAYMDRVIYNERGNEVMLIKTL